MFKPMAQSERVRYLTRATEPRPGPVGYWVHAAPRAQYNHALEYAVHRANTLSRNLFCFFALDPSYPDATPRHMRFLVEGLIDFAASLHARGIEFGLYLGNPLETAIYLSRGCGVIVTDRAYSRIHRRWYAGLSEKSGCPVVQVESNVVVPAETVSDKEEYSAATIRRKINGIKDRFLIPIATIEYRGNRDSGAEIDTASTRISNVAKMTPDDVLTRAGVESSQPAAWTGGESAARGHLDHFLDHSLSQYHELRSAPDLDWTSHLSPYLHFGHISPVEAALNASERAAEHPEAQDGAASFLEELIVRRELAVNYVLYNSNYDDWEGIPSWAKHTLAAHETDPRSAIYTPAQLENAETHDRYWNACQNEMRRRGTMHNYMRMYWGKKILEWNTDPRDAFAIARELNDRYELDGRDPNGWTGVAWCFGKHDRPWPERPIFGTVRYMNDSGLRRKFKSIEAYVARWTE